MNNLTETAARLWAKLYPERRPWAELEPETRAEWERFVEVCAEILSETLTNKINMQTIDLNDLFNKVRQWGEDKGITGTNGKATAHTQCAKFQEEAQETIYAVATHNTEEIKDGIGDTIVTLILLAERCGMTAEECLESAYGVISKRTGKMIDGQFVKES